MLLQKDRKIRSAKIQKFIKVIFRTRLNCSNYAININGDMT